MRKVGRVVELNRDSVGVSIAGNAGAGVAPCCAVPASTIEAKNPAGLELRVGDAVAVSDGLGPMALGVSAFALLPAIAGLAGAALDGSGAGAAIGAVGGAALALFVFKALRLGQYPKLVGRTGTGCEDNDYEELP